MALLSARALAVVALAAAVLAIRGQHADERQPEVALGPRDEIEGAQAGVFAIDAPCFALHDADRLQADLTFAAANGFEAKAAIHPSHIESINTTFTPSAERVTWAKRVVEAAEKGAGTVDGRMVDEAIAREARRVLAAA